MREKDEGSIKMKIEINWFAAYMLLLGALAMGLFLWLVAAF